jgi:hypothetical protein
MKTSSRIRAALFAGAVLCGACANGAASDDDPVFSFAPNLAVAPQACVETRCPAPFATCDSAAPCTIDLKNDVEHCGACDNPCPKSTYGTNGTFLCSQGVCQVACNEFFADCNHDVKDGCETPTYDDPLNCGGCGVTCKTDELCWRGACGCPKGFTVCGSECVQLDSDDLNCSACGKICDAPKDPSDPKWICGPSVQPAHTKWTCGNAQCEMQCVPGWGDCDKDFCGDGCEIDLAHDDKNCGACGNACAPGQWCNEGTCSCPAGTTRCHDQCVDLQNDAANCGYCGARCPGPSSTRPGHPVTGGPQCVAGECTYVCKPGYADCNKNVDDGCEVDLNTSQKNCGSCGTTCNVAAGQPCVLGACLTRACELGPGPR